MANRTYLIQSASAVPAEYDPDRDILAASNYSVPVFWYALFDAGSVIAKPTEMGTYPFLITTTAAARKRFADRSPFIQSWLPKSAAPAVDDFRKLLDTIETSHIHLETIELWMMDEPGKFQPHVEMCLRAFELARPESTAETLLRTAEWQELLDQIQIDASDVAGTIEPHMLTGRGWVRPVPWKE